MIVRGDQFNWTPCFEVIRLGGQFSLTSVAVVANCSCNRLNQLWSESQKLPVSAELVKE